jgi:hypothetical protein
MMGRDKARAARRPGKLHYRGTVKLVKEYLKPVEPAPAFADRLEELCRSMGGEEVFRLHEVEVSHHRRNLLIGGAIFSALPVVGVAAYAIGRHISRRRVAPLSA